MSELDEIKGKIDTLLSKVIRLEYAILILISLIFIFFALSLHLNR